MTPTPRLVRSALALGCLALGALAVLAAAGGRGLRPARAEEERVAVPKARIRVDDGDSITIRWAAGVETVRLLGIDAPETLHLEHRIPFPQPFGDVATGFLRGCIAQASSASLLRSGIRDRYGRTLAYLLLDGRNVSVLLLEARLAVESISRYGDNGLPAHAAACLAAAEAAGPVAFEDPGAYRRRMRDVTERMLEEGSYPRSLEETGR